MNIFKIVCIVIATTIGAGFVTGQEIMVFFNQFGFNGILGLILMTISFIFVSGLILSLIYSNDIKNYEDFINLISKPKMAKVLIFINTLVMLIFYIVMIAGACAFFRDFLGFNYFISGIIFSICCYIVLNKSISGVIFISDLLIPLMIIGILIVAFFMYFSETESIYITAFDGYNWVWNSILYVGYNILPLIGILCTIKPILNNKFTIKSGALLSGLFLGMMGFMIYWIIASDYNMVVNSQIPLLQIINSLGTSWGWIYNIILIIAIFTSAIIVGYSFLSKVCIDNRNIKFYSFWVCVGGVIFSFVGFSNLVKFIYPLIGVIGIFEIILIMRYFLKILYCRYYKNSIE